MQTMLKVTIKGQLTLRKDVLRHLGIAPGDTVIVESTEPGRIEISAAPRNAIAGFFGCLKRPGQPVLSIEAMNEVIAKGWAGKR